MAKRKRPKPKSQKPQEWQSLEKLPTERQSKTFQYFVESGCDLSQLAKCAEKAGYPKPYARMLGFNAIKAHAYNPLVLEALKKHKVTIDRTVGKISKIMDAKHPNPKFVDVHGRRADDSPTQLKAAQTSIQLLDIMPSKKVDISAEVKSHERIEISMETIDRVKKADAIIEGEVIDE